MGKSLIKSIFVIIVLRTFYVICAAFIVILLKELKDSSVGGYDIGLIIKNILSIFLAIIAMVNTDRIIDERKF